MKYDKNNVFPQILFHLANHCLKYENCRTASKYEYNNIKINLLMSFIVIFIFFKNYLKENILIWYPSKHDGKQLYCTIEKKLSRPLNVKFFLNNVNKFFKNVKLI